MRSFKKEIVEKLGAKNYLCWKWVNDVEMFKICRISIATIEGEGVVANFNAHRYSVKTIGDAIGLILNKDRMKATLRN